MDRALALHPALCGRHAPPARLPLRAAKHPAAPQPNHPGNFARPTPDGVGRAPARAALRPHRPPARTSARGAALSTPAPARRRRPLARAPPRPLNLCRGRAPPAERCNGGRPLPLRRRRRRPRASRPACLNPPGGRPPRTAAAAGNRFSPGQPTRPPPRTQRRDPTATVMVFSMRSGHGGGGPEGRRGHWSRQPPGGGAARCGGVGGWGACQGRGGG
jgi:translation initiation factor IF-2